MPKLRVVVYEEQGLWVAHGLEYSIVGVSKTFESVRDDFSSQVEDQVAGDRKAGQEPFYGFRPALKRFWDLYEKLRDTDRVFDVTF